MTLKELTIKRGLRAECALRYIVEHAAQLSHENVIRVCDNALDDITNMIREFEEEHLGITTEGED